MPMNLAVEDEKLKEHAIILSTSVTGSRTQGQVYQNPGTSQYIYAIYKYAEVWKDIYFCLFD